MLFSAYALFRKSLTQTESERGTSLAACSIFFGLILATVAIGRAMQVAWDARGGTAALIPLLIFVQTTALAASWGVALTFGSIVAFVLALSGGASLGTLVVFVGTATIVALASRGVRTRSQLIGVAFASGVGAFVLSWLAEAAGTTNDRAYILGEAAFCGLWALLAGFLTSGLLPIVERVFGVLTPMRLLEYGNPSHPLLLELNRRAPATYNHSIQTAAIAEAAAEAIGARASLIRVGAYFHDVGKMLQPERFTENQRGGYNVHDELEPRMSALVIVAHVKDGVDLAKRYHIPRQIVDLIEQHHGTMLAGFFYQKANEASKDELPAGQQLDEAPFRYPGPIPQSKEAAILMLADAAESASRSLGDVAPGRIENLVRQLVTARLEDGQLNDSGLTLGEIRRVETSMVTSILASRHNRVKYPATAKADDAKETKEEPRDNFRPLSSEVAPTDAYEFVRQPGIAPTSRKVELEEPTTAAEKKTRDGGFRGAKKGARPNEKTSKPGASGARTYPKNGRKKRK
jgi:putative nucleotidyltransferase with HDIG domain